MKKKIVVFYGYKGSGKDTCHDMLKDMSADIVKQFSFAEPLRNVCWSLFGKKIEQKERLYGSISRKEEAIKGWIIPENIRLSCGFTEKEWTGRRLLQWMGTDVCRNIYDNIWVDMLVTDIQCSEHLYDIAVVTDCRFKNEYEALKKLGNEFDVQFIYVDRGTSDNAFSGHASERDMADFEYDICIENRGTKEELEMEVSKLFIL